VARKEQLLLLTMESASEAPFLVGARGRNISLVRKLSGLELAIRGLDVLATPFCAKADPLLGRQLALSACTGGVLRWFVTPRATEEGYPAHLQSTLKALANEYHCDLQALRSPRGHVCLMLVPRLSIHPPADETPTTNTTAAAEKEELALFRQRLRDAREALLLALEAARDAPSCISSASFSPLAAAATLSPLSALPPASPL
jgi:hypothetical protein